MLLLLKIAPWIGDRLYDSADLLIARGPFLQGQVGLGNDPHDCSVLVYHWYPPNFSRYHHLADDLDFVLRSARDRSLRHQLSNPGFRSFADRDSSDGEVAVSHYAN